MYNKIFYYNYNHLFINFWLNHGIKITIVDEKQNCSVFANVADKNELVKIRDELNKVIDSM